MTDKTAHTAMTPEALLPRLGLAPDAEAAVGRKLERSRRELEAIAETAYAGEMPDFPLCRRMPLTRLAVIVCLLARKYAAYQAAGADEDIILDTFRDVSLRAELYRRRSGGIGVSKDDVVWFRHIMNGDVFKLGALQYQKFSMIYLDEETIGEPYMTFSEAQKLALPGGAPVLNCHIPAGADLSAAAVGASLRRARAFFAENFPAVRYRAFLCYSWLLYPPMLERLPESSRIRCFAAHFEILGTCGDGTQALENLFPDKKRPDPAHYTALQALAAEHPELLGYACGVIRLRKNGGAADGGDHL